MEAGRGSFDERSGFTSAHELLDGLRARQAEIGLSNAAMADLIGVNQGQVDDWLGPSRVKAPGLFYLMALFDVLGLSGRLMVDAAKMERMAPRWQDAGKRKLKAVRTVNSRVSQAMVKRAVPEVARQMSRLRWDATTPEERSNQGRVAARGRWDKDGMTTSERSAHGRRLVRKRWPRKRKKR